MTDAKYNSGDCVECTHAKAAAVVHALFLKINCILEVSLETMLETMVREHASVAV